MKFYVTAWCFFAFSLFAEPVFRMDLGARSELVCRKGADCLTIQSAAWRKEGRNTRLSISGNSEKKWKEYSFSFVSKAKGTVELTLMGDSRKAGVCFDNIRIRGAKLLNGDFEELRNDHRTPLGWAVHYGVMTNVSPASGNFCVEVNRDKRAVQPFPVETGNEITVTFQVRSAQ